MPTKRKPNPDFLSSEGLKQALAKAHIEAKPVKNYNYRIQPPTLARGVLPSRATDVLAMDGPAQAAYEYASMMNGYGGDWVGFPGYPYLAALSTRAEYRMFAQSISTSLTREWIVLNSTETAGKKTKSKVVELTQMITDIGLKDCIALMADHESFYGRAQMALNLGGQDIALPLILSPKVIEKKTLKDGVSFEKNFRISAVEALWTTPKAYNAINPMAPDFYKPPSWFMLGQEIHATRLLTVITRPVSDMLKPAFNFGGMSMSQLAESYVDNWLRTRQSVSDLINNFSIVTLSTAMEQILNSPGSDASSLFQRIELFTLMRSNGGVMLLDKDREELEMFNVPIGGLAELQAQSQEQMCSVSHTPAVILLGVAPTGFGNVAEGEMRTYYDWVAAIQENYWRKPIETVINILQLIRYGQIDPDIVVAFQPLYQMTPKELAEIRKTDGDRDVAYIQNSVLDATEVRENLARNPESGYQGIDTSKVPLVDNDEDDPDESGQQLENEDLP